MLQPMLAGLPATLSLSIDLDHVGCSMEVGRTVCVDLLDVVWFDGLKGGG